MELLFLLLSFVSKICSEPDTPPGGDFENRCPFFKTQQNIRTHPFLCKIKKDTLRVIPQNTLTQTAGQRR